ncbi:Ig-like domain-containing protein [Paenibacillus sp. MBLB4367]|uniref:Ig-like domain-containing protein n=1 Tax=Paenibacillus sp. MBLB4367 TaxID=3384767 RepID=UPI0039082EC6
MNSYRAADDPSLAVFNNEVYAAWRETDGTNGTKFQIRVKKYNGTGWMSVDGGGPNGLNIDASKAADTPIMAVFKGDLYIAWQEMGAPYYQIKVKKYNGGSSWTSVDGSPNGLNIIASSEAGGLALAVFDNTLYATWHEKNGSNIPQIRIKKYDGITWTSVDGGGSNGLNLNPLQSAVFPSMAVFNNSLYVAWSETASGSTATQIRVRKYDGTSWTTVDGGGATGLNINAAKIGVKPALAAFNNALYLAWEEPIESLDYQIRVKKYDGDVWTSVDGGGTNGLNINAALRAGESKLTVFNNELYLVWQEVKASTVFFQIHVKKYDGASWTSADGGGANGLNANVGVTALYPAVTVLNNDMYVAWQEKSGSANQIRLARYTAPAINSVSVIPSSVSVAQGGNKQLTASVDAVGGAATTVTWSSSDTGNKVTVSSTGKVTVAADAPLGIYTITATSTVDTNKTGTATITVTEAPAINSVSVIPSTASVVQGGNKQLTATVDAVGGAATTVTWSSSDAGNKVKVNSTGKVTVAADATPGDYTITATSTADTGKKGTATITVTAAPAINSVTVIPSAASVVQGGSKQLTASVDAVGGAATSVTWKSNDAKVAVSSTGNVTIAADATPGDYTITATSTVNNSKTGTATITVTAAPAINSVSVIPSTASVVQGESKQLTASVDAVGGAATTVAWSSSDAGNKVTVNSTGNVTVAADASPGDYTITATSTADTGKTGTATITVTAAPAINSVTVIPNAASVVQGGSKQLTASVDAVGGAVTSVTWKSNDAKVAVSSTGNVTVAADATPGDYTIKATSTVDTGKTGTATITVTAAPAINSVSVIPSTASVVQGGSKQLTASVDAVGGAATTVTWSSSDTGNKVTVSSTGNVTIAADATPGDYTITATSTVDTGKAGTATITVTAAPAINSVTVIPSTASVVQGGSKQLTASVDAVGGAAATVTWSSSDAGNKVTVSSTGNVTVAADATPGDYTITASSTADSGKKGTATITVTAAPAINSVSVIPNSASIMQGGSKQLTASVDAVGGASTSVTWSSSDAGNKVTVSSAGNVTVAADATPGDYTITATSTADTGKKGTATISVTAAPAINSVIVNPSTASVVQGGSKQLTASVDAVGGSATTVTWSSSDAGNKVTVSSTGNVTVAADATAGDYTITATSTVDTGKKGTATITVTAAPAINSVTVIPSAASVVQGGSKQLTASVDAVGGASTTVTWSSSDTGNKVTVSSAGNVTVAADATPGNYTITATSTADTGKTGTATITVTAAPAINSVTVIPSTTSVVQGGSKQLTASIDAVGGASTLVTWSSSDTGNKVTVNSTGNVTVAADATPGDYTITATSTADTGKKGTATITVTAAPTYTIGAITDQTLSALTQGYESGTQETRTIPVMNIGTGNLMNLSVTLSGANANDFVMTQRDSTLASNATTSFDIHAKDDLPAGTYTATVTVSADHMTPVTFIVTQAVNLPNAPANPQNFAAAGGDRQVTLSWNTVSGATYYRIYMATDANQNNNVEVATVTSSTYNVPNLVNGTTYYFVVKSENSGGLSAASNQASATPSTIPGMPANVTAVAGDGQAIVTFTAPIDNGGSAITEYEVTASPGNVVMIGGASPITLTGLTNGTSYTFTVKAINGAGRSTASAQSNAVIPRSSSTENGNPTPSQPSAPTAPEATDTGVDILINGKVENAGTATVTKRNNQTEMTVVVDQKKLNDKLAAEGQHAVVTIPINKTFDVVVGVLNGQMVKNMEDKQAVLEFKTDFATYTLPARQINIGAISEQLGELLALQDIKVRIEIAVPTPDSLKVVENAAAEGQLTLVAQPLSFTVRAVYGNKTVEVTTFDAYVERTITIPDEVDPGKITTGVVVEPDGTVRHVPTKVRNINGKYEAQINSLTNSTYAVVWHPLEFSDAAKHWAKNAVNDMGSRMIVDGTGNGMFSPDREITRAEFAAIIVRGLGLKLENGATPFSDVKSSDWYSSAVYTTYAHRLISGLDDGTFRPNDKITREQAMVILSKAMAITGLKAKLLEQSADSTLRPFEDAAGVSSWAQSSVADNVQAGIVFGRNGAALAPKGYMTRAEVASMMQRLLQKSGLI